MRMVKRKLGSISDGETGTIQLLRWGGTYGKLFKLQKNYS